MGYQMGAYPPGTHAGDPNAPWNEEAPRDCRHCEHWWELPGEEVGLCLAFAQDYLGGLREAADDEALLRAVANLAWDCTYEEYRHCTMWEEG